MQYITPSLQFALMLTNIISSTWARTVEDANLEAEEVKGGSSETNIP